MTPNFQVLFEQAPGLYLVLSPSFHIVAASNAYLRATMTDRHAIIGRHLFEVFPDNPDDPQASGASNLAASLQRVVDQRAPDSMAIQKYDVRRPEAQGGGFEERFWSPINLPVLDADGNLVYLLHCVADVSDLRRAKGAHSRDLEELAADVYRRGQELQETNRVLRQTNGAMARLNSFLDSVVENLPNMIFVKAADTLRFERINRAGEALLGITREALLGKNDFDFFPPAEAEFFQSKDRETLKAKQIVDIPEESIQTASGPRWLHTRKVPIVDADGRPRWLLGISVDITDTKRTSEALSEALEEKDALNRELEAFSYSVAHDLRAPLRSIDGFSQALLEDFGDKLDATGKGYLARVRGAAQRMALLIDDLLDLSRVARAALVRAHVDVTRLAHATVAELRERDPARVVDLVIEDGLTADADPRLLGIVFENLLGNAWKFTARRERARIEVGRAGDGFFVRDDGAGFDMAYAHKLFGAFQRLHATAEFPGTGIGLAIVQRILRRHGGTIRAEGAVGRGATFFFTLGDG